MVQLSVELQKHIEELQTLDECKQVWKLVKERWREIEDSLTASAISKYKIGQIVQFVGKRKRVLYGKITFGRVTRGQGSLFSSCECR